MSPRNGTMPKTISEVKAKGKEAGEKLKSRINEQLKEGRSKLMWLEDKILGEKGRKAMETQLESSKQKLGHLKKKFTEFEEKAVEYTEKNPKKALAIAAAAGILVGTVINSLGKKKQTPLPPRKTVPKVKKAVKRSR